MIELTKLNNEKFYMNPNLIEIIEQSPDTIITMTSEKKYIVLENVEEINKKLDDYYRRIYMFLPKVNKK
jgi:flagellar protein FlbD